MNKPEHAVPGVAAFDYSSDQPLHTGSYLTQPIISLCKEVGARRVLDLGCGNGALCAELAAAGFEMSGVDASEQGLSIARKSHPGLSFFQSNIEDAPPSGLGLFDAVVSTEVVEHLYAPRLLPRFAHKLLKPGGRLILSTPYHGYLKNLAITVMGGWDRHMNPLWDGGHIKFWSNATLSRLLSEEGFRVDRFVGTGRIPWFWKSIICLSTRVDR